jgi:hypothetical protein
MHPYAHPLHLKVLNHFVYIQYGFGMQSMGVFRLYHDTATSYRAGKLASYGRGSSPRFVKISNGPNTNSEYSNLLN